jgi:hypothetical protein
VSQGKSLLREQAGNRGMTIWLFRRPHVLPCHSPPADLIRPSIHPFIHHCVV